MHRHHKIVALLLALAYSVIAVAGHGLHALAPCCDDCQQAEMACDCMFCQHADEQHRPATDPAFDRTRGCQHNPHTCAVCSVLAKVKVGHGTIAHTQLVTGVEQGAFATPTISPRAAVYLAYVPRGPPAAA